jgi:hypothetical protein
MRGSIIVLSELESLKSSVAVTADPSAGEAAAYNTPCAAVYHHSHLCCNVLLQASLFLSSSSEVVQAHNSAEVAAGLADVTCDMLCDVHICCAAG